VARRLPWLTLLVPLALLLTYAELHWFQCDDAFISYRYVRNLVAGNGLVFNVGERVEGFTNLLWVLELALARATFGWSPEQVAPVLSFAMTALLLPLVGRLGGGWRVALLTMCLLAVNRSVAVWTTSGLETRQFSLLVVWSMLALHGGGRRGASWAGVALGLAAWTRPEGVLLGGLAFLWLGWRERPSWRRPRRTVAFRFALVFGAFVLAMEVFRVACYGALVPNTFFAKQGRPWPAGGAAYFALAILEHGVLLTAPLLVLGARRRPRLAAILAVMAIPHALYTLQRGGDHFGFRTLDYVWPPLAVLIAEGCFVVAKRWLVVPVAALAIAATGLVGFEAFRHEVGLRGRDATYAFAGGVDAETHPWSARMLGPLGDAHRWLSQYTAERGIAVRWVVHREFRATQEELFGPYAPFGEALGPEMITATGTVGVMPYRLWPVTVIDTYGLTDPVIARSRIRMVPRYLAHERAPPAGYLRERGVNVWIHRAVTTQREAHHWGQLAVRLREGLYMPVDTDRAEWVVEAMESRGFEVHDDQRPRELPILY